MAHRPLAKKPLPGRHNPALHPAHGAQPGQAQAGDLAAYDDNGELTQVVDSDTYPARAQDESIPGEWSFPNVTNMGKLRVRHTPSADITHPDWGATGDGTADDLQALIDVDTFFGTDRGTIFAPPTPNSYFLSAPFRPSSKRLILGAGRDLAQLSAAPANYIIELDGIDKVTLRSLGFTHGATAMDSGAAISNSLLGQCSNVVVDDCSFFGIARQAVQFFNGVIGLTVKGSLFEDIQRAPVVVNSSERILVITNEMIGFGDDAIAFVGLTQHAAAIANIINHPRRDGTLIDGDNTTGAMVKIHHRHITVSENVGTDVVGGLASIKQNNAATSSPGEIEIGGNVLNGMSDASGVGSQAGLHFQRVDTWDGTVDAHHNIIDTRSPTTAYTGVDVRTGGASTATGKLTKNTLRTGGALSVHYQAGPFSLFDVDGNEVDTDNRAMRILTPAAGGDLRFTNNTGRADHTSQGIILAETSAKLDSLTVKDNDLHGAFSTFLELSSTALGELWMGANRADGATRLNGPGGVDVLKGRYSGRATHDFGSIPDGGSETVNINCVGARLGMHASATHLGGLTAGVHLFADVTAANTVSVTAVNRSGAAVDPANALVRVEAWLDPSAP